VADIGATVKVLVDSLRRIVDPIAIEESIKF
jgi:hypothetical protein